MAHDLQARNWEAVRRFATACESDERVIAAFLGGSMASGKTHPKSDVDVYVIIRGDKYETFLERVSEFLGSWGRLTESTLIRDFEGFGFDMVLFAFSDGVRGELALGTEENFMAMHGGPHQVLLDRTGMLDGVAFPLL